jgi:type II restriction enzyme
MFDQEIAILPSAYAEAAIDSAKTCGRAVLKFISPNDVGETGSHQCGYLLPKNAWQAFTRIPPQKVTASTNPREDVRVLWQDGRETESVITWYGRKTRSEYRLTRFGKDFPYLTKDNIGSLLVLIPSGERTFHAFVLDTDADFAAIEAALGVSFLKSWALFDATAPPAEENEDECLKRHFSGFIAAHAQFPKALAISEAVQAAIEDCIRNILTASQDRQLVLLMQLEYDLFRMLERKICQAEITRLFKDVDDFIKTASSIVNRRKSRAGRSLENHVTYLLRRSGVIFESQPRIDGEPDIVFPSAQAYLDPGFPVEKLIVMGLKTTCKDRWRQVLNEGRRVPQKHLLTMQHGITENQLKQMQKANVTLVVPKATHRAYPTSRRPLLLSVKEFIRHAKQIYA